MISFKMVTEEISQYMTVQTEMDSMKWTRLCEVWVQDGLLIYFLYFKYPSNFQEHRWSSPTKLISDQS